VQPLVIRNPWDDSQQVARSSPKSLAECDLLSQIYAGGSKHQDLSRGSPIDTRESQHRLEPTRISEALVQLSQIEHTLKLTCVVPDYRQDRVQLKNERGPACSAKTSLLLPQTLCLTVESRGHMRALLHVRLHARYVESLLTACRMGN
jgi:hypothetical protein